MDEQIQNSRTLRSRMTKQEQRLWQYLRKKQINNCRFRRQYPIGPYIVGKIYNLLWRFCRNDRFLIVFYFSGVCATCFDSTYPFARGYFFAMLFAFLVRNFLKI